MSNPTPNIPGLNIASRVRGQVQIVSDTKFATKVLPIGAAAPQTDFFTAAPGSDPTLDNYDAGNMLVTSDKKFVIQGLTCNVISTSIADVDAIIQKGVIVLTCQNKEVGRFRVRHIGASGGTFVAGAQVAAASSVGVTNGVPDSEVWRISDLMIDTNQSFKATLLMPNGTAYTCIAATSVELALIGYEIRPAA